jgi:hypothetical protein
MRPNQQNNKNRSRGRNNNGGRKHGNPLSRNYESTGPDVKVRGNAAHIAEKYVQLARDAQSSGDSVMAENYLQHAEHYVRILYAAQAQQGQVRGDQFSQQDEDDFDDDFAPVNDRFSMPERPQFNQQQQPQSQPQPATADAQPTEGESEGTAATEGQPAEGETAAASSEGEPRRHRERRPRRRSRGQGAPDNAPQPDVGERPAFLTAGNTPAE